MNEKQKYNNFVKGLKQTPPVPCDFPIGATVTYTNEYGVPFSGLKVIGYDKDDSFYGRFIYLDKDSYWFPVKPEELTLEAEPVVA